MRAMQKSRPLLTAACFLLFALAFVSANVKPNTLYCGVAAAEVGSVHRLVDDVRRALADASRWRQQD
jgi:hypothetical protein